MDPFPGLSTVVYVRTYVADRAGAWRGLWIWFFFFEQIFVECCARACLPHARFGGLCCANSAVVCYRAHTRAEPSKQRKQFQVGVLPALLLVRYYAIVAVSDLPLLLACTDCSTYSLHWLENRDSSKPRAHPHAPKELVADDRLRFLLCWIVDAKLHQFPSFLHHGSSCE